MNIIIVPNGPTLSGRQYCIAKELQAQGHSVTYFMWQHPLGISKKELLKHVFTSLIPQTSHQSGFTIHKAIRLPLFWPVINGWIFKAQLRRLYKKLNADIIFTESYTNETEVPNDLPFIYDLADDYAGPSEVYGSRIYKLAFKLLGVRTVMRRQCKNALAVTAVSSILYDYAKRFNDNTTLVPNGVERDLIENTLVKKQSVNPHSLVYATGLGPWSRAVETLETVTKLRKEFPDISLTLVGAGTEVPKIKRYIEEHDAQDYITYIEYVYDRQELFILQSQHAIGLNISDKNAWRDASHPMKVMDYSALGMKGVSTNLVEVEKLGYDNLFIFSDTDKHRGFQSVLRQALKTAPQAYKETSDHVLANYSWTKLVSTISDIAIQALKSKMTAEQNNEPRIVHVTYAYPPAVGGLEQVAQQLASSQAAAGLPVSVITSDKGWNNMMEYTDTLPVTRLKSFVFASTTIIPGLLWQLLKLHKNDIVHLHVAQAFSPEIVWLASKIKGFRYVAHIHIDAPPSTWMGFLLRIYKPIVLGHVLRSAHGVAVFTKEQKKILGQRYHLDSSRMHIIPNGVADEFFINKRRSIHKKPRLLFVGRLSYQKNLTQLLDALDGISDQFTTTLVGDGELRADLEAHAKKLNLKNIKFAGFASGATLRTYYEQADIFVLPSEREGMPLVLLEAMAAGLPIVATRVTGNKDVVKHLKNGLLVPYGNSAALRMALVKLSSNKPLYRNMSHTASRMAQTFTWAAVRERFTAVYPRKLVVPVANQPVKTGLSVKLPIVIVPLLALAIASYAIPNIIGSAITLLFFLTVPGHLMLRYITKNFGGWWERTGLSVVLSLLVIMVGGLLLNSLHAFGLDRPLTTTNVFTMLSLSTLLLVWLNRKEKLTISLPTLKYPSKTYLVVAILLSLLPILAVGGAIRLNNGASNILTMIMFFGIAVLFIILLIKKDLKSLLPYALFIFALSILLSTSLRGWLITGHDIRNEFQLFENTSNRSLWLAVVPSRDTYNSCLSISILPTILHKIAHLPSEYIYKAVYQILFAFGIIPMLYMFRKFLSNKSAFIAGFIVITFPVFINDMTFLNRQEIAFMFFIALLSVTFSQVAKRPKYILTIALLSGILLSHYSTNYVTVGLLVAAFIIYKIISYKSIIRKNLVVPILSVPVISFAILSAYLWGSIVTQTSPSIEKTVTRAISAINNGDDTRSTTTRYSLFNNNPPLSRQEILADYAKGQKSHITYVNEDILPLSPLGNAINGIVNIEGVNTVIHSSIAKLYQVLVVLGTFLLVIRYLSKRRNNSLTTKDSSSLAIISASVLLLVMLTILPYVSVSYDVGRLFMQTLFITAVPIVIASEFIFHKTRRATYATACLFAIVFLFISGALPQLVGGYNPKIALANSGTYYNFFYEHRTDRVGGDWLLENTDRTKKVFLDTDASSKLPLPVSSGMLLKDTRKGYIFEGYRNVTAGAYRAFPNGELIEYADDRVAAERNLIYANQGSAIYSPVLNR